jgi:hypothetical protein
VGLHEARYACPYEPDAFNVRNERYAAVSPADIAIISVPAAIKGRIFNSRKKGNYCLAIVGEWSDRKNLAFFAAAVAPPYSLFGFRMEVDDSDLFTARTEMERSTNLFMEGWKC